MNYFETQLLHIALHKLLISSLCTNAGFVPNVVACLACFLSSSLKANSLKFKDELHGGWQNKCFLHWAKLRVSRNFSQKQSSSLQLFGEKWFWHHRFLECHHGTLQFFPDLGHLTVITARERKIGKQCQFLIWCWNRAHVTPWSTELI